MKKKIFERLLEGPVIMDGAMGTYINSKEIPRGECYDYLNITHPDLITSVHREYITAGAEIITTNTFSANQHILKYFGLENHVQEINKQGTRLVKEIPGDHYVAASVGPISRPYEDVDRFESGYMKDIYLEQIGILLDAGADIIKLETFSNLNEILLALEAVFELHPGFPVSCSLTYLANGKTMFGVSPDEATRTLKEAGARMIGANCGIGPQSLSQILTQITSFAEFVLVHPNAGQPVFQYGQYRYPVTAKYFSDYAIQFIKNGVNIIGGCCGTTPEHIKAVYERRNEFKSIKAKRPVAGKKTQDITTSKKVITVEFPNKFRKILNDHFSITVEVDPPKTVDNTKVMGFLKDLKELEVSAINVADVPMGRLRQSSSGLAYIAKRELDLDVILHFTCRDKNLIGIQSDLLTAYSPGINNILALTGDPPSVGDYPFATAVYEVDALGLVGIISHLNEGKDYLGNEITTRTDFNIGVAAGYSIVDDQKALDHLKRKIASGAHFVQTQPIYDIAQAEKLSNKLSTLGLPKILGIIPLVNYQHAEFLKNEVSGITVPDHILKKFEGLDKSASASLSIELAVELIGKFRDYAEGVCIMTPFNRYGLVKNIIKACQI